MTIYTPQCEQKRLNVNDRRVGIKMSWGGRGGGGGLGQLFGTRE